MNSATAHPRLPFHSRKKAFLHLINSGRAALNGCGEQTIGGKPATICRLNLVSGLGPALQIAEGETIELPEKAHRVLEERTNPTRPMFRISMARARSATPTR